MVHVARESRHHDQSDVYDEKGKETEHGEEVDGPRRLPSAKDTRVPRKSVHNCRRHGDACEDRQRTEDKDNGEISDLLQCVVPVKPVWLLRQMKRSVVHPRVPCLQEDKRRSRHNAPPLLCVKEHTDENNTGNDKAVNVDEVPNPGNTDRVPIARRANERRNITGIIFRGPDAIAWHIQGRKPNPFAPGSTAVVEI